MPVGAICNCLGDMVAPSLKQVWRRRNLMAMSRWWTAHLLTLRIVDSNRSIRDYRRRGPVRSPNQTWRTFLCNHAHYLWAGDAVLYNAARCRWAGLSVPDNRSFASLRMSTQGFTEVTSIRQ